MRKEDKLIKEALKIYETQKDNTMPKYEEDRSDSWEDKIYGKIAVLDIPNPRKKAHIIWVSCMVILVVFIGILFFLYGKKNHSADITKNMEILYKEGYFDTAEFGIDSAYGRVGKDDCYYVYRVKYLKDSQTKFFQKKHIVLKKTNETLQQGDLTNRPATMLYLGFRASKKWDVYRLADRKSKYYCVLKDESGNMALARYLYTCKESSRQGEDILKTIYGIQSPKDVRNITLERYQERSKDNTDRILSISTKEKEKEALLSVIQEMADRATRQDDTEFDIVQEGWQEVVRQQGDNCYYMTIENKWKEKWVIGVFCKKSNCILFASLPETPEKEYYLPDKESEWLAKLIRKADKTY